MINDILDTWPVRALAETDEGITLRKVLDGSRAFVEGADSRGSRVVSQGLVAVSFVPWVVANYASLKADKKFVPGSYEARIEGYRTR